MLSSSTARSALSNCRTLCFHIVAANRSIALEQRVVAGPPRTKYAFSLRLPDQSERNSPKTHLDSIGQPRRREDGLCGLGNAPVHVVTNKRLHCRSPGLYAEQIRSSRNFEQVLHMTSVHLYNMEQESFIVIYSFMTLTDIAIEHTYRGKRLATATTYTVHPFENEKGEHRGKFEILRDIKVEDGGSIKRSAHVTRAELIELYARGLMERETGIRIRVRPSTDVYPTSPLGKAVPRQYVSPHTAFDRDIGDFDASLPIRPALQSQLRLLGLFR
ncbi:hypothetical protein [Paraburkholderia sp. MM6662-R1]|uniref:hypothetical protein n=1 Tax=Paraburkholderia sp. MM6662-R1 TaxID=2991066 RepID=UPI003D1DCE87